MSELLTPEELADRLSVPAGTLSQWRYLRKGPPFIHLGKHVRYRVADVEAWLASCATNNRNRRHVGVNDATPPAR